MPLSNLATYPAMDALLVLGRGIDEHGVLSETSQLRAALAVDIARIVAPRIVVFSGGHSWRQERAGEDVPSEGGAMLAFARARIGQNDLEDVTFLAEEQSLSTIENLVNSKPLLELSDGETLGVLTDVLHDQYGRVTYSTRLVFPKQHSHVLAITPNRASPDTEAEEKLATAAMKVFMFGVRRGNDAAIMRRQHLLEKANSAYRVLSRAA